MNKQARRWKAALFLGTLLVTGSPTAAEPNSFEVLSSRSACEAISGFTCADPTIVAVDDLAARSSVPEPGIYMQIIAGLGLFGFVARRAIR